MAFYRISLTDGTLVAQRTIDDKTILNAYSVAIVDLNGNGQKQLLTNNHQKKDSENGVYAYTVPTDIMTGEWTKYTLASDFKNAFSIFVPNMAPGFPYAVYPDMNNKERAHIMIAGDGDHSMHVLTPEGDSNGYEFKDYVVVDASGTVGALAFADLDEDNWLEVYMPNYDKGYIQVWKISAAKSSDKSQLSAVELQSVESCINGIIACAQPVETVVNDFVGLIHGNLSDLS